MFKYDGEHRTPFYPIECGMRHKDARNMLNTTMFYDDLRRLNRGSCIPDLGSTSDKRRQLQAVRRGATSVRVGSPDLGCQPVYV